MKIVPDCVSLPPRPQPCSCVCWGGACGWNPTLTADSKGTATHYCPPLCPNNWGRGLHQRPPHHHVQEFPSQAGIQGCVLGRRVVPQPTGSPGGLGGTCDPALWLCFHLSLRQGCPSPKASHQYPICHSRVIYNMKKISNYLNIQQQVTCQLNSVHSMAGSLATGHRGLPREQPPPGLGADTGLTLVFHCDF